MTHKKQYGAGREVRAESLGDGLKRSREWGGSWECTSPDEAETFTKKGSNIQFKFVYHVVMRCNTPMPLVPLTSSENLLCDTMTWVEFWSVKETDLWPIMWPRLWERHRDQRKKNSEETGSPELARKFFKKEIEIEIPSFPHSKSLPEPYTPREPIPVIFPTCKMRGRK